MLAHVNVASRYPAETMVKVACTGFHHPQTPYEIGNSQQWEPRFPLAPF